MTSFLETSEGINLRYLRGHALVSSALYSEAITACAAEHNPGLSRSDCSVEVTDLAVANATAACQQRGASWRCPIADPTAPHYGCCTVLAEVEDRLGLIDIYGLCAPRACTDHSPRPLPLIIPNDARDTHRR